MKITIFLLSLLAFNITYANSLHFFESEFKNKDGCFLLVNAETGKVIDTFNLQRCKDRFSPMSTFKIPLVAMAFDSEYFKSVDQKIKWDGKNRGRKAVNQNQTPKTFIAYSVIWVSRLIVNFLEQQRVQNYLDKFNYGNRKISGDFNSFWLTKGSIKVSAEEQVQFLSRLWLEKIPINKRAIDLTKEAIFDRQINNLKVFGKTGTGCIDKGCMNKLGRQLGWYVGIVEKKEKTYAFALNFSDLKVEKGYGGPKAKKIVHRYFKKSKPSDL